MSERVAERRDTLARAARDRLGLILHIHPRDLVRVAGMEAASMVEGILDERARNRRRLPPHVWLIHRMGMKPAVVAVDAYLRRSSSLVSKEPPPGRKSSSDEVQS